MLQAIFQVATAQLTSLKSIIDVVTIIGTRLLDSNLLSFETERWSTEYMDQVCHVLQWLLTAASAAAAAAAVHGAAFI